MAIVSKHNRVLRRQCDPSTYRCRGCREDYGDFHHPTCSYFEADGDKPQSMTATEAAAQPGGPGFTAPKPEVRKPCPDCNDRGTITLLTSVVKCRCSVGQAMATLDAFREVWMQPVSFLPAIGGIPKNS